MYVSVLDRWPAGIIIHLLIVFGAAALLLRQIFNVFQYLRSELRSVPGPLIARLTSGWYAWQVWQGSFQDVNRDLHQRYGKLSNVRTW